MSPTTIHPAALDLIIRFETGGSAGYKPYPEFPGEQSGLTIGIGYDLGYVPGATDAARRAKFGEDWRDYLTAGQLAALLPFVGARAPGDAGQIKGAVSRLRNVVQIDWRVALLQFQQRALPRAAIDTMTTFPGSEKLPDKSFGALVSLAYNRGTSLVGERRSEMAQIAQHVKARETWRYIVEDIAGMARLWPDDNGPTASNLMGRRYAEAHLFAAGLRDEGVLSPDVLVLGDKCDELVLVQSKFNLYSDGIFGPATLRATLKWQKQHDTDGRPATGVIDVPMKMVLGVD